MGLRFYISQKQLKKPKLLAVIHCRGHQKENARKQERGNDAGRWDEGVEEERKRHPNWKESYDQPR